MVSTSRSLLALVIGFGSACGKKDEPQPALVVAAETPPAEQPVSEPEVEGTTTTTSTTSTTSTSTTTGELVELPPEDREPGEWTLVLASVEREASQAVADELSGLLTPDALTGFEDDDDDEPGLALHRVTFTLEDGERTWVIAGSYILEDEAKSAARKLAKRLGRPVVASSLENCDLDGVGPYQWKCGQEDRFSFVTPLQIAPPELRGEAEAPPAGTVPAPIVPAPAEAVLVVGSNLVFEPGKTSIDTSPKFRTWIWRPARGELPTKGSVTGEPPVEGADPTLAPIVEEHSGLQLAAGRELWTLSVGEVAHDYPRCDCDDVGMGNEAMIGNKSSTISLKFSELIATSGTTSRTLLAFTPPKMPSMGDCASGSKDIRDDWQLAGVAGSLVFVVHRTWINLCEDIYVGFPQLDMRIYDLAGGSPTLEELERELDPAELGKLRSKAATAIDQLFTEVHFRGAVEDVWPENLRVTALYPRYREWKGGQELLIQYGMHCDSCGAAGVEDEEAAGEEPDRLSDDIDWGQNDYVARQTSKYPASSRLTPPPDAAALLAYVQRAHGNWKTIGWSRVAADGSAPAPAPVPAPVPDAVPDSPPPP